MIKKVSDFQKERRIGRHMRSGKVGLSIGALKKESGFIVGMSSFLGSMVSSKPHSNVLCRVFDLCYPFSRRPLSHANKFAFLAFVLVA